MPDTIFTLGYEKRSIEQFVAVLREHHVDVLIDVRETAWSHKPGFSKAGFARALDSAGIEYVHARFAGNPKWLRSAAPSHADCLALYDWYLTEHDEVVDALDRLLAPMLRAGRRACLTCFERHPDDCHRAILAHRWSSRAPNRAVEHLAPDGCARLVGSEKRGLIWELGIPEPDHTEVLRV